MSDANQPSKPGRGLVIGWWGARLVVVGIFAMGAIPKFAGNAGALAEVLPGGNTAVMAIGAAEVAAIVLMLVPKTGLYGAALAAVLMVGAVGSHVVGPVGMEGDLGAMLPMAVFALVAAVAALVLGLAQRRRVRPAGAGTPR